MRDTMSDFNLLTRTAETGAVEICGSRAALPTCASVMAGHCARARSASSSTPPPGRMVMRGPARFDQAVRRSQRARQSPLPPEVRMRSI